MRAGGACVVGGVRVCVGGVGLGVGEGKSSVVFGETSREGNIHLI